MSTLRQSSPILLGDVSSSPISFDSLEKNCILMASCHGNWMEDEKDKRTLLTLKKRTPTYPMKDHY
jgi:hypothetical protein